MEQIMYKDIDPEKIKMVKNRSSSENSIVTTFRLMYKLKNETVNFKIQLPSMIAPFGISNNSKFARDQNSTKWSLQLSFKNEENDERLQVFRQKMEAVEKRIQYLFYKNFSDELVPIDNEVVGDKERHDNQRLPNKYYTPIIKKGSVKNNISYPDIFKINISWDYDKNLPMDKVEFFDAKANKLAQEDYAEIQPGSKITSIVSFNAFYVKGAVKKFGANIKLVQLQYKNRENFTGFQIKTDGFSSSDEEEENDSEGSGGDDKNKSIYDDSGESVDFSGEGEGEEDDEADA